MVCLAEFCQIASNASSLVPEQAVLNFLSRQAAVQHSDSGSDRWNVHRVLLVMVVVEVPIVVVAVPVMVVADLAMIAIPVA
jgi:hypothetical protein